MRRYTSNFKSSAASLAILTAIGLLSSCSSGGGSSSSGSGTGGVTPPPAPMGNSFTLDGAAAKGLILGGAVSVVDPADETNVLATGTTSAVDGSYSGLAIPASANFTGPFVKLIVTGGNGATMICDAPAGCAADGGFGDEISIGNDVSLSALAPSPADGGSATVNITALTDMAAAAAGSNPDQAAIDAANSQVASLFGIVSNDLASLPVVNIASADADASSNDATLAALVSGGILEAVLENPAGIGEALAKLSSDFAANSGQIVTRETTDDLTVISLEEIIGGARDAADATPITAPTIANVNAALALTELGTKTAIADSLTNTDVTATDSGAAALEKAKAFVDDVQLLDAALNSDDTQANIETFENGLDVLGGSINGLDDTLSSAIADLLQADAFFQENPELVNNSPTNFWHGDVGSVSGVTRSGIPALEISNYAGADVTFTLIATGNNSATTSAQTLLSGGGYFGNDVLLLSGDEILNITGTLENAGAVFDLNQGQLSLTGQEALNVLAYEAYTGTILRETSSLTIGEFALDVNATITPTNTTGATFNGLLSLGLTGLTSEDGFIYRDFNGPYDEFTTVSAGSSRSAFSAASLAASGIFTQAGKTAEASLSIDFDSYEEVTQPESFVEDFITFSLDADKVIVSYSDSGQVITYDVVSYETMLSRLEEIYNSNPENTVPFNEIMLVQGNGRSIFIDGLDDQSARVRLFFEGQDVLRGTRTLGGVETYIQVDIFDEAPTTALEFVEADRPAVPIFTCAAVSENLVLIDWPYILNTDSDTSVGAYVFDGELEEGENCFDEYFFPEAPEYKHFNLFGNTEVLEELQGTASASLTQDVAGVDADDPSITFTAFGPYAIDANGELSGSFQFVAEFAGKRYATNALSFAQLDNLSELTITNQDDVELLLSEGSETGVITVDGAQVATLSDDLIVTYFNGDFESLQ